MTLRLNCSHTTIPGYDKDIKSVSFNREDLCKLNLIEIEIGGKNQFVFRQECINLFLKENEEIVNITKDCFDSLPFSLMKLKKNI